MTQQKRALISGVAGFVGRHFATRLLDEGWEVTGVDNLVAGVHPTQWAFKPRSFSGFSFHEADFRDWMKRWPPQPYDLIIHCAAVVGGRLKIDGDPLAVATDLSIDADFFNWLTRHKSNSQKVVYFSSSAAYPVSLQGKARMRLSEHYQGFNDNRIGMPDMTYGMSKLIGEYLAKFAVENYGLDVVTYRPFGGYGEDQSFDYPFPSIVKRVLDREDPVVVWGSGDQTRDFIHIDDIVSAVLETMHELKPGEVLNLGSGVGTSFRQLADAVYLVCRNSEGNYRVQNDPTKPEGVFWRVADTTKLNLMFTPKVGLEEGIRRVADFLRKP